MRGPLPVDRLWTARPRTGARAWETLALTPGSLPYFRLPELPLRVPGPRWLRTVEEPLLWGPCATGLIWNISCRSGIVLFLQALRVGLLRRDAASRCGLEVEGER